MVEFLSSEAGTNGFSTEQLLQTAAKNFQEDLQVLWKDFVMDIYFIINLEKQKLNLRKAK